MNTQSLTRTLLFLLLGVWACSTAVIWIRLSTTSPELLSAWRLTLSALLFTPWYLQVCRTHADIDLRQLWINASIPGLLLAAHFISWAHGARMTTVTNASLIVNMSPLVLPFILHAITREHVSSREWKGILTAGLGILILCLPKIRLQASDLPGIAVCFASMLAFTFYLVLGRKNRTAPNILLYILPVYTWAAVFCTLYSLPFHSFHPLPNQQDWPYLFALAIIPTMLGHGLLNQSMRHASSQLVSVCNQGQFLFAGIMGYFILNEWPDWNFIPAALLVILGSWLVATANPTPKPIAK